MPPEHEAATLTAIPLHSVHAFLGRNSRYCVRKWPQMDRLVVEPRMSGIIKPAQGVFQPIFVIAPCKILARMGAAAFLAADG